MLATQSPIRRAASLRLHNIVVCSCEETRRIQVSFQQYQLASTYSTSSWGSGVEDRILQYQCVLMILKKCSPYGVVVRRRFGRVPLGANFSVTEGASDVNLDSPNWTKLPCHGPASLPHCSICCIANSTAIAAGAEFGVATRRTLAAHRLLLLL